MRTFAFLVVLLASALLAGGAHAQTPPQHVYLPAVLSAPLQVTFAGRPDAQSPLQIYTAYADGSRLTRLTDPATRENSWPSWAPDGRRITFVSYRNGTTGQLYEMDADGGGQARFGSTPRYATRHLRWSPDGSRLAYIHQFKVTSYMNILNVVTNQLGGLNGYMFAALAWSPDSQRIAYIDSSFDIRNTLVDQTGPVTITSTPERYESGVSWSPDGTQLAYTAEKELYLSAIDGSGERLLTSEPDAYAINDPVWSPDGTLIAYTAARSDFSTTIIIARVDGTGKYELPTGLQYVSGLSWRPR